jgi:heat shock protein HtpX
VVETVPITVFGVGEAVPWEPQPASATAPIAAAATMTAGWRTAQDSNEPLRPGDAGTGGPFLLSTIRDMQRRNFGRDRGLSVRMLFTGALLGLLYVGFAVVLFSVLNFGLAPMLLIVVGLAFFQYYTSDKLALKASGAKVVSAEEAPDLHAMVERLCAMANLPKPRIAVVDTDVPNAFATGRNPKHAAVAVTTGLWRRLEPQEVEGVLAHELSHIANRDVLVMTIASFFAMLAALLTRFGLYAGMFGGFGGGNRDSNNNSVPIWLIIFLVSVIVYAISFILIRTISRYREYAADRGSAIMTGAPENLMSALQKISSGITQIPQQDLREVQGMNAFFIIPTNWKTNMSEWMMDHPPLEKRLAALSEIAREMGKPVS